MVYRNDDISLSFKMNSNYNHLLRFIQPLVVKYKPFSSNPLEINNIKLDINIFHDIIVHTNEREVIKSSKSLDLLLMVTLDVCGYFSLEKSKSNKPCEREY